MTFSGEELDAFYGPSWSPERIAIVRKYCAEPRSGWTQHELIVDKLLLEAVRVIESVQNIGV